MKPKNILVFMSDQHTPLMSSYMGGLARTPVLEEMAKNGMNFEAAYTACPLCVPARMAFMSGRLPSKTGILNNYSVLPDTVPTVAHAFAAAGYETVLVGRMHFVGENQRHGFHRRLVGDITSPEWKPTKALTERCRGPFMDCFAEPGCTQLVGGGGSPVQEFDETVVKAALEWLSQPHDKPQFIVVGTYGPHFPYVAAEDKYRYYKGRVSLPPMFQTPPDYLDPALKVRVERATKDPEKALGAQAAYCGMIETIDEHIGAVREAFFRYCRRAAEKGVFLYTSDHGDQCGERGLYGKMSFFEKSVRIPLLLEGDGIPVGEGRKDPVSLIDLVPTLCKIAETAPPPGQDGQDIMTENLAQERAVISELYGVFGAPGKFPEVEHLNSVSRMVRKGRYKYITRAGFEDWDLLFDLENDPDERENIIGENRELAQELKQELAHLPSPEHVRDTVKFNWEVYDFMQKAQKPSQQMLNEFWVQTSPINLKKPEVV